MNTYFKLRGQKQTKSIYIYLRDAEVNLKTNTGLKIDPKHFKNGKVKTLSIPKGADAETKQKINQLNQDLQLLQKKLDAIKDNILSAYNQKKEYEILNNDWLKSIIKPKQNQKQNKPKTLIEYFDYYIDIKRQQLRKSTIKKINVFKNRLIKYQKHTGKPLYIQDIDKNFSFSYQKWSDQQGYAQNTKKETLKMVKTICYFAEENGTPIKPQVKNITKGMKSTTPPKITLSFDELDQLMETTYIDPILEQARDWLVISCYTALRVSDLFTLDHKMIKRKKGKSYIELKQQKTENPVMIVLNSQVMQILKKRNGKFPPLFSKAKASNEVLYNRHIKEACRLAGINEKVTVNIKNHTTNRYEIKEVPKWKAIASHIGRRSFATNYYGMISTPLLMAQTGHKTEKQFLEYIGKTGNQQAETLAEKMELVELERTQVKSKAKVLPIRKAD